MGQIGRIVFASKLTVGMALAALFHFRMGVDHLYPLAQNDFTGPFTGAVDTLEFIIPVAIAVIVLSAWVWVIISPTQQERAVRQVRRR
jgi:hypothetical protein